MSDRPLFENSDAQEATYAPQQLPHDEAVQSERARDDDSEMLQDGAPVPLPIGAAGVSPSGPGFAGNTVSDLAGGTTLPLDEPVDPQVDDAGGSGTGA